MNYSCIRNLVIDNTFEAGMVVGSLRSFLAGQSAGEIQIVATTDAIVTIEIYTYSAQVMAYVEDKLAPFV